MISETQLFSQNLRRYALTIVGSPALKVWAMAEPFENRQYFSLRVVNHLRQKLHKSFRIYDRR